MCSTMCKRKDDANQSCNRWPPDRQARKIGKHKTKKDAVNTALEEYIRRHHQAAIADFIGSIDYDPSYDYKRERAKKRS